MAKKKTKLTPMIAHYMEVKENNPEHVLFYRMGDFYEMFFDDARLVSKHLNLNLTKRAGVPMAGFPHHSKNVYIKKLIEQGFSVAICEQVEDPATVKGRIVKREITHILTPGVQFDYENLDPDSNNYLLAISNKKKYFIAYFDVSTLDFFISSTKDELELLSEINKISPSEIIIDNKNNISDALIDKLNKNYTIKNIENKDDMALLYSIEHKKDEKDIINLSLGYINSLNKLDFNTIPSIKRYEINSFMNLPATTINNLEIFKTSFDKTEKGSLFKEINKTITSMGARKLKYLLTHPLKDVNEIETRLNSVEYLINNSDLRRELEKNLKEINDIERLLGRILSDSLSPKDLLFLSQSLKNIENIITIFKKEDTQDENIKNIIKKYNNLNKLVERIDSTIREDVSVKDEHYIKKGVSKKLDKIISISENSSELLIELETREKLKTKIPTLKVKFNKIIGYFIEVSKSYLKDIPEHYDAKQVLVNNTRFFTQELKDLEINILEAKEKRIKLEKEIYSSLLEYIKRYYLEIKENSSITGNIDLLYGFSELAISNNYTKPQFLDGDRFIEIKNARHPVIENNLELEEFIPNSISIDNKERLIILTGPNMSGKSTIMREIAIIVLMAQIGSYVPADFYMGSIFDAIFTRVGAGDNLSKGESTFMMEMKETAEILKSATKQSLIIVDELGRGTSTFDGLSLAWAIAEYIHDNIKAITLFATHYHELTKLKNIKKNAINYSISIKEIDGELYFLRKLLKEESSKSYGINVAKLAGIPEVIIKNANSILMKLEKKQINIPKENKKMFVSSFNFEDTNIKTLKNEAKDELREKLKDININSLTPLEALNILSDLKKKV